MDISLVDAPLSKEADELVGQCLARMPATAAEVADIFIARVHIDRDIMNPLQRTGPLAARQITSPVTEQRGTVRCTCRGHGDCSKH